MKFLIAGLGNNSDEYANTRHNIGFRIADALAGSVDSPFFVERHALHSSFRLKGKSVHLIKPSTYMNLSGKAVKYWIDKLEVPLENLLVIVDDVAIPFGQLRIRGKGSDGSHNGLTSVHESLQTSNYTRLRFGIGSEYAKGHQVNYVLGRWTKEEEKLLPEKIKMACDAVKSFVTVGLERTMEHYNKISKQKPTPEL